MTPTLTFARKRLIGVVHLKPLPGSPRFADTLDEILKPAVADARAYERGGADAIFIVHHNESVHVGSVVWADRGRAPIEMNGGADDSRDDLVQVDR